MFSVFVIHWWDIFLSCKAESVGVFIPPQGPSAVSHRDLERDMRQIFKGNNNWVPKRMAQMGWIESLETNYLGHCFVSSSHDISHFDEHLIYTFYSNNSDWSHVVHLASMLSFAKGLSSCEIPVILCGNDDMTKQSSMTSFYIDQNIQTLEDVDVLQLEHVIKNFIVSEVGCQLGVVP